jgi:hypothetical protein
MRVTSKQKLGGLVAVVVGTAALVGCQQVPVNSGPSAVPPAITWSVTTVGGGGPVQFGANGALNIQPGKSYDVSAHAQSPSGVKSLTVSGSGGWSCRSGDVASSTTADLASVSSNQEPQNGKAWDTLSTFEVIKTGDHVCQAGFSLTGGGFGLTATAKNFAGMTGTGHLSLTLP